jgi:hypothetical protein
MKRLIAASLIVLMVSGCATYRPMVDFKSSSRGLQFYQQDLAECQRYAEQISPAGSALVGAAIGAAIGAVVFAGFGLKPGEGAAWGAGSGALGGATSSGMSQVDVIRRCMQARGYTVLQ